MRSVNELFNNLDDALGILKTTRNAAAIAAAITSMTIVGTVAYTGFAEYLPRFVAFVLAAGAIAMVAFVIDYGLRKTLPLGFDLLISGQWFRDWRTGAFLALLLSFNFIQAYSSVKLSWEGRKEAVAAIQQAPQLEDIAQTKRQVDQTGSAKIRAMDSEISKIRKDIERKESEVERLHPTYIDRIKSGSDKWGWYAKQLDAMKKSKTSKLQSELTALISARTNAINAETETAQLTVSNIAATNTAKWDEYEISKTRNMTYIGYFGAGCTLVVVVISLMLSLLGQSNVVEIEQKSVLSPIRKVQHIATPPHVAPAVAQQDDFSTQRAIEMLQAETLRIKAEQEAQRNAATQRNATPQRNEKQKRNEPSATSAKPVSNGVTAISDDALLIESELKKARNNLRAYESKKRRNEGNPETLQRGVAKWAQRVDELEKALQLL